MAKVEQYRPRSDATVTPVNTGNPAAGQEYNTVFAGLSRIGGQMDDLLDRQAEKDGAKDGGLAGLDPKFRPTGDATIRGEAYDRAGLRVATARIETEQTAKAEALAQQFRGDPAGLAAAFDKARDENKQQLGTGGLDALWPQVEIGWDRLKVAHLNDATRAAESTMRDADRATAIDQIDARTKRIQQLSFSSGNNEQAAAAVQGELAGLEQILLEHGPREAFSFNGHDYKADPGRGGALNLDDIQHLMVKAHDTAIEARVLGRFALVNGADAQQKFRDGVLADYKAGKLQGLSFEQVDRLSNHMDADISHSRAQADAQAAGLRETLRDTIDGLKKGFPPSLDLNRLNSAVRMSGNPELAARLGEAEQLFAFQQKARKLSPAALDQWLSDEHGRLSKGANAEEVSRYELAQNIRDNMQTGLKRDPLQWAAENGGRPLPPLDFKDAGTLAASMRNRMPYADAIARDYGIAPTYFTDAERTALGTQIAAAPAADRMAFLGAVTKGVPSARLPAVIGELAKESPALAQAASLVAAGNTRAAIRINAGLDILRDRKTVRDATTSDMVKAAQPFLSGLPGGMTAAKGAMLDAATAIYVADQANRPDTEFDEAGFQRALEQAAGAQFQGNKKISGGFDYVHGAPVLLPPEMTADQVENLLLNTGEKDLPQVGELGKPPVYQNGKPVSADTLRNAYPVSVGDGLFAFSLTDPANGAPELVAAKTARGYYVMDIRALRKLNPKGRKVPDLPAMGGL